MIAAVESCMFGRFLTLLAALVFGALLVLAHDIVGIVHQFVVVRVIVGVAVDLSETDIDIVRRNNTRNIIWTELWKASIFRLECYPLNLLSWENR